MPDNFYYQNFSYSLKSQVPYGTWNDPVSAMTHTAGFQKFGDLQIESKEAGFTANKHRVYWHSLLSMPLFLFSMVLIAATFSLRLSYNRKGTGILIIGGVMSGFVLYVFSDIIFALGLSGKLPAILAAWTPAGICTLIGFSLLFHLEDG